MRDTLSKEKGTVYKEHGGRVRVCLVYPNSYSLGMTNLGFQSVYHMLNSLDGCVCERAFMPGKEDLGEYGRTSTPLFSYETQTPVKDFDIIAFSVPFEDDYVNVPRILELAGVPILSVDRACAPLVMAGGVAVSLNPEPVADFFDLFIVGEGEGALAPVIDAFRDARGHGPGGQGILRELDRLEWVYVPSFYVFSYDGVRITRIEALPGVKKRVRAAKLLDLGAYPLPENFILTPASEFKDTSLVEIERGCPRGCRFCAAGFLYLPPRWRDFGAVKDAVGKGVEATGKVGLVGTAVSEYPEIKQTLSLGVEMGGAVTLSSLRLDRLDAGFVELLKKGGYRTVTLAPEAGSERMRWAVNKGMTDGEILDAVRLITAAGFLKIKLYFIVGLPAEVDADAEAIVALSKRIKAEMKKGSLTLSVNPFIPKPCTPFQWHPFEREQVVDRRLSIVEKGLSKIKGVSVKTLSAREAFVQAYISRADRRAGRFIAEAAEKGWRRVIKENLSFFEGSVYSERGRDEPLAWDMIDHGVRKGYLWKEHQRGARGELTPPCDVGRCFRCGVC
ncbi:MAG: radical SAM protein [Thermodesulfobacteriota bacterium]